jgi:monoamine oxidase
MLFIFVFVRFACGHLVVAVPPALYNSISWFPSLPPEKMQLSQRMPMGSIIKTVTYYEKPFWRLLGLSGEAFDSSGTPVVYSVDDCKPDGSHPAIMGFVSAHAALKLQLGTLEQRKVFVFFFVLFFLLFCLQAAIAAHYRRVYGFSAEPIGYVEQNWNAEPLSGGCYMGVCPPGVLFAFGPHLRTTVGRVHFAGTETAVRWSGYADGAVESGQVFVCICYDCLQHSCFFASVVLLKLRERSLTGACDRLLACRTNRLDSLPWSEDCQSFAQLLFRWECLSVARWQC